MIIIEFLVVVSAILHIIDYTCRIATVIKYESMTRAARKKIKELQEDSDETD